jgi:hypothetical protein
LLEALGPEDEDELSDDEVEALELDIEESVSSNRLNV